MSTPTADEFREVLLLAETFYDGTDYHFDRLTPDEQCEIVDAARLLADILEQGEEMEWCETHRQPAWKPSDYCRLGFPDDRQDCRITTQLRIPSAVLDPAKNEEA